MKIQEIDFKRFSRRPGRTGTQKSGMWQPVGGGQNKSFKINALNCPTGQDRGFEYIAENPLLSNLSKPVHPKENPGALAGATGDIQSKEVSELPCLHTSSLAERHPILFIHWGIDA